jgi:hypothetical protein
MAAGQGQVKAGSRCPKQEQRREQEEEGGGEALKITARDHYSFPYAPIIPAAAGLNKMAEFRGTRISIFFCFCFFGRQNLVVRSGAG